MIHGFGCGAADWGRLPQMLASRGKRQVLCFDHRGVGGSRCTPGPCSIQDLARDSQDVLEAAALGNRVHLLGISMGGMVSQHLALESPGLVASLTLGATTHGGRDARPPPPDFLELCGRWIESDFGDAAAQARVAQSFVQLCAPPGLRGRPGPSSRQVAQFAATPRTRCGLERQFGALARFNSTKYLANILAPTLVIHGGADAVIPPENGESLASKIPGARLLKWGTAGHFFWFDKPLELVSELDIFFQESERIEK